MGIDIALRQGSLTEGDEDVLVNASNTNGNLGSGVSAAIRRACGDGFQDHIHATLQAQHDGPMDPGDVLVTDAGAHPRAHFVAHVAVMDYRKPTWDGDTAPGPARIERACRGLWAAIETLAPATPRSVAMVALGAGTGGLGVRVPTEIACSTLKEHLADTPTSNIARVVFYGYELTDYVVMGEVLAAAFPSVLATFDPELRAMIERLARS